MSKKRKITIIISCIIMLPCLFIGGYIGYMSIQYYRIDDFTSIATENNSSLEAKSDSTFSISTYNIGFGAYDHDFSFFMDSGEMKDGTKVKGKSSRAKNKETVIRNTKGTLQSAEALQSDFYFFQEVDTNATRSYHVNQYTEVKKVFPSYGSVYTNAFHSAYLLYPFSEPHGSVQSGLVTLSKYKIQENIRRQYPIDSSFVMKFTDLDRCFTISRLPLDNGKQLVLINSHMSAYDKGGTVRAEQLKLLNTVLDEEYKKGNYVIVGGDFNHDIADSKTIFPTEQKIPEWIYQIGEHDIASNFSRIVADNYKDVATCRSSDMPYKKNVNYTAIVDGFLVSDNIKANAQNIDTDFMYSDHNPVKMTFTLK